MSGVLFVVTARGGSKGIPRKNVQPLGPLPLLAYRLLSCARSRYPHRIIVSTDDEEIAGAAREYGAEVPFLRPASLATDGARCEDAVLHAIDWVERNDGQQYEFVCMVQPTSPFTKIEWIDDSLDRLEQSSDAEAVVSVREVRPSTFYVQPHSKYLDAIARRIHESGLLRRQDEAKEVTPSGNYYVARTADFVANGGAFYTEKTLSSLVPDPYGLEIDEPLDWEWASFLLQRGIITLHELGIEK